MKKLLENISWRTRKWNIQFELLSLNLHNKDGAWGFKFITFTYSWRDYSLLSFNFRLPNKTNIQEFTIDEWDILFLNYQLWKIYDKLDDRHTWNKRSLNNIEKIKLNILNKIFK